MEAATAASTSVSNAVLSRTSEFLGRAVLSLYQFGIGGREEHLLLMLMETALEEEVKKRVNWFLSAVAS